MRLVIVTGMSGAGKTQALRFLEDADYFCVDNLPVPLLKPFTQISMDGRSSDITKIAVGIDIRSGAQLGDLVEVLEQIRAARIRHEILFLDATDSVLIKRYKETRRVHPLAGPEGQVEDGIREERKKMAFLRERADYIIDTSYMLTRELRQEIDRIFVQDKDYKNLYISVMSFGFKYGIPPEADLVFDVRFLPNPYYDPVLRKQTGNDAPVRDYVMGCPEAGIFLDKLTDMVDFLLPNYVKEGKNQLVIAIGCTGGRHRSVTLANGLFERLGGKTGYGLKISHRDLAKDPVTKQKDYGG